MAAKLDSSPKMASYLSRFSPVPTFPEYTGPYKVGTMDVEIAVSELISPAPTPEEAADIPTVQFRIFYPATDDTNGKPIPWLPTPQRPHVSGYTEFIGISKTLAGFLSCVPLLTQTNTPFSQSLTGGIDFSPDISTTPRSPFIRMQRSDSPRQRISDGQP